MVNEPSISVREWIKWKPDAASEPTLTLVLTSAGRRFVDIRILKPVPGSGDPELPNDGGPMTRLDWGFAGTSTSRIIFPSEDNDGEAESTTTATAKAAIPITHSQWTHWIDSRHDAPITDEGYMEPQADGIHVLEKGEMVNPDTGKMTAYEEFWADPKVEALGSEGKRSSVVLVLDDEVNGVKGMVVRVGQWCQGIVKVKGEIGLERWQWTTMTTTEGESEGKNVGDKGEWKRIAKLGRMFLPCSLTFEPERVVEGSKVSYGDYKWEVKELFSW